MKKSSIVPPPDELEPDEISEKLASEEEKNWANLDRIEDGTEKETWFDNRRVSERRSQNEYELLKLLGPVSRYLVLFLFAVFVCFTATWAYHLLAPSDWHWLDESQLAQLQSALFSGGAGSVAAVMWQKLFSK